MDVLTSNLLVVDDCVPLRRTLRSLLRQLGFRNIDETGDVESALAKMRDRSYRLVISDYAMAPKSGLDFLNEVRADENLKNTPFLIVSGIASPEQVRAAKEAGVDGYIVKPFSTATLRRYLKSVLDGF